MNGLATDTAQSPGAETDFLAVSPFDLVRKKILSDRLALIGGLCAMLFFGLACMAPLIANRRPLLVFENGSLQSPALEFFFAPDSGEEMVERSFNYLCLALPACAAAFMLFRKKKFRFIALSFLAAALLIPFLTAKNRLDRSDWKERTKNFSGSDFAVFAPIACGPFDRAGEPLAPPGAKHLFGTDQNGRDVLCRMLYGARISLAVGLLATAITMLIGIIIGMVSGYFGGRLDALLMRIVEIIMCFPTFLLLLILMVIMMDMKFKQSVLLVVLVIGLTSWTGLSRIVRGEVLKEKSLPYVKTCECLGLHSARIMFLHILPNVLGPILVSFTFGIAGAILSESGLSFLGFGVQPPTASWGELLREAMSNPLQRWHLTLWPGIAIFLTVISFNFIGEGFKKAFAP